VQKVRASERQSATTPKPDVPNQATPAGGEDVPDRIAPSCVLLDGVYRFSFFDSNDLIHWLRRDLLLQSAGPVDFDLVYRRSGAQAKVDSWVGTGAVTSTAKYVCPLPNSARGEKNFRSSSVPRTLGATDKFQG
jgi:hypothetical protein